MKFKAIVTIDGSDDIDAKHPAEVFMEQVKTLLKVELEACAFTIIDITVERVDD